MNPGVPIKSMIFSSLLYTPAPIAQGMPKGLKQTSSTVAIGFGIDESGANTFTQGSVDLNLSPLDNEVFVVQAVNMEAEMPDAVQATDTKVISSLTTTSQTSVVGLANSNCMATKANFIQADGFDDGGVAFQTGEAESTPASLEFLAIIATNDFFIQVKGVGNLVAKGLSGKLYGYRARAEASIYSALVQGEVLSA